MNKKRILFHIGFLLTSIGIGVVMVHPIYATELQTEDFSFNEPLGSEGTTIERVAKNHFHVRLGHAPHHPDWCNKLQGKILRHAKGNTLRLDVTFEGGNRYILNEYYHSWSYDGKEWYPIHWQTKSKDSRAGDTLVFPVFEKDTVYIGHQTPMSYEDMCGLIQEWEPSPYVTVNDIGTSVEGRVIQRITLTDPESPYPPEKRWVHYFANQHPGEHNSQWRMVGMIRWLLSDKAKEHRQRSICHFVLMMSPDAPSKGWYRVNAQGVDMNRSYRVEGSDKKLQAQEAYLCQHDLESLMASSTPVTDIWSMHTWGGIVEPICIPGPEMGTRVGEWKDLREKIMQHDQQGLIKPLTINTEKGNPTYWTNGPHQQFGITAFLCEGGGGLYTQEEHLQSGQVLIQSILEYYGGVK